MPEVWGGIVLLLYKKLYNIGCEKKQKIRCDFIESG